jgi:ribosomal protein S12 methylthiotransferase accessory factor
MPHFKPHDRLERVACEGAFVPSESGQTLPRGGLYERVASLIMEMLVLDQTRPDIGMPFVKVLVPGLRHFWPRFAPGRLYEVPVRLGWLPRPLTEEQLNPIPMFL